MDSVALVDTFGAYSPQSAAYAFKKLKERLAKPVEAHFHDDFGLSVATTIASVRCRYGSCACYCKWVGELADSCPLEPLVISLQCLYGINTGIKHES